MPARIDIDQIRRDNPLNDLAARYGIKLARDGREWKALCPFHREDSASFYIFPAKDNSQRFFCFGCGVNGDVIDFVCEWHGLDARTDFRRAVELLPGAPQSAPPRVAIPAADPYDGMTHLAPPGPCPFVAGQRSGPIWNPKRGRSTTYKPAAVYEYPGVGYVLRVEFDGHKITPFIGYYRRPDGTECWSHGSMPAPRPLYRLASLAERPDADVLVVEGEKCADAAAALLADMAVVSWPGGGKATGKVDWTPLAGRRVTVWPDNDAAGVATAADISARVPGCMVMDAPGPSKPDGWDVADAISTDWMDADDVRQFIRQQSKPAKEGKKSACDAQPQAGARTTQAPATIAVDSDKYLHWQRKLIMKEDGSKIVPRLLSNFRVMLECHPDTRECFAWNDVTQGPFVMRALPWETVAAFKPRPLLESDNLNAAIWMERHGLTPRITDMRAIVRAVSGAAHFNPVRDYLAGLQWDGCPRLIGGAWEGDTVQPLAVEYFGAPEDAIYSTFVWKWHVAAVARALRPGCKMDTMLILESPEGKFKSTYFRRMATIGGHEYFLDNLGDITNKDSIMLQQGTWLAENSELTAFTHRDMASIKSWLSRTTDSYIPKYEGERRDIPRNFAVAGTHNPTGRGWLRDHTGGRRFWPVPVTRVDLDRAERDKDQIWAEACHLYNAGKKWWLDDGDETTASGVLANRRAEDAWWPKIDDHIKANGATCSVGSVLSAIGVPVSQQNAYAADRVADRLSMLGLLREGSYWRRPDVAEQESIDDMPGRW